MSHYRRIKGINAPEIAEMSHCGRMNGINALELTDRGNVKD